MTKAAALLAALALAAGQAAAAPRLTEAQVRAFVERQDRAWNARDSAGYFQAFLPQAVFVEQTRTAKGEVIRYGASRLPQARAQAQRFFAKGAFHQATVVERVEIASDGQGARVFARQVSTTAGRTACAETEQVVVVAQGQIRSRGLTETAVRCRR